MPQQAIRREEGADKTVNLLGIIGNGFLFLTHDFSLKG